MIEVRALGEAEVPALIACLERCYGDSYSVPAFYQADKICELLQTGRLCSEIAVTRDGRVVGHLGLLLEHPCDSVADAMLGTVDPDFRGQQILARLGGPMIRRQQALALSGIQLYALTLHTITQRQILDAGGIETGLLVAHHPTQTRLEGFELEATRFRPSAVMTFMKLNPLPARTVYLPQPYRDLARGIYASMECERTLREELEAPSGKSELRTDVPVTGALRIFPTHIGADFHEALAAALARGIDAGCEAVYLDLPLDSPASIPAVEAARTEGLFFGGLIPERGHTDRLRLQWALPETVSTGSTRLYSDQARRLFAFVLDDARAVGVAITGDPPGGPTSPEATS